MSVTTYYPILVPEPRPEDLIRYHCVDCETEVPAADLDTHAKNKHRADLLRTFTSETGYKDYLRREEAIKEMS